MLALRFYLNISTFCGSLIMIPVDIVNISYTSTFLALKWLSRGSRGERGRAARANAAAVNRFSISISYMGLANGNPSSTHEESVCMHACVCVFELVYVVCCAICPAIQL